MFLKIKKYSGGVTDNNSSVNSEEDKKSKEQQVTKLKEDIDVFKGEKIKLDRCEVVIAVVGTMKAGKSTTINAIVGREVLPSRGTAMTSIPTLITHDPNQNEPILTFSKEKPIKILIEKIKNSPKAKNFKHQEQDITDLLNTIRNNQFKIKETNKGDTEIFSFLKKINDLVRLSEELGVDFPYEDYKTIDTLPVIKVKFAHLPKDKAGVFTILDTPGHNEAGQNKLKTIVTEQLKKASGVLLVFDYSQLNTEASAEVQQLVKETQVNNGLLYVVANKMDLSDRNGKSSKETQEYIKVMLNSKANVNVDIDNIFPVSSSKGYLAGKALVELENNNKLPNHEKESWVADFYKTAFGDMWEMVSNNSEMVKAGATKAWETSNIESLLSKAIQETHQQALYLVVKSSASKLQSQATEWQNYFNGLSDTFTKSSEIIDKQIKEIESETAKLANVQVTAEREADSALRKLSDDFDELFKLAKEEAVSILDKYFKDGQPINKSGSIDLNDRDNIKKKGNQKNQVRENNTGSIIKNIFKKLLEVNNDDNSKTDFNPNVRRLTFGTKSEANNKFEVIMKSIDNIRMNVEETIKSVVDSSVKSFNDDFSSKVTSKAYEVIGALQEGMKDAGFTPPDFSKISTSFDFNISSNQLLTTSVEKGSVTRSRRKSGAWGTVCSWFGTTDWGWEDYEEDQYYIYMDDIQNKVVQNMEDIFININSDLEGKVKEPLNDEITIFFTTLKSSFDNIQNSLRKGLENKKESKEKQIEIQKDVEKINKDIQKIQKDVELTISDLSSYMI